MIHYLDWCKCPKCARKYRGPVQRDVPHRTVVATVDKDRRAVHSLMCLACMTRGLNGDQVERFREIYARIVAACTEAEVAAALAKNKRKEKKSS